MREEVPPTKSLEAIPLQDMKRVGGMREQLPLELLLNDVSFLFLPTIFLIAAMRCEIRKFFWEG